MNDFEKMVSEMRSFQRQYFKERDIYLLRKSKELEQKVDAYLREKQREEREPTLPGIGGAGC